jgi:hypothetical protein
MDTFISPHPVEKQYPSIPEGKHIEVEPFEIDDEDLAFLVYVEYSDYNWSATEHLGIFSDPQKAKAFFDSLNKERVPKMFGMENSSISAYLVGFVLDRADGESVFTCAFRDIV